MPRSGLAASSALIATLWCAAGMAAPATAQDTGVHIDPESPAAKEYGIPIEQARRSGAGGGPSLAQDPFGEGIGPPAASIRAAASRGSRTAGAAPPNEGAGGPIPAAGQRTVAATPDGGVPTGAASSPWLAAGLLTAAALAIGAGAGVALRRSRR